jgi:predicted DCC family thiol-disulfide oxidoreductase YuxK
MTPELREACRRALHVLTADGTLLRSGRAALFVLERTTRAWHVFARVFRYPPLVCFVELGYRIVAENRSLFGRLLLRPR